MTASNKVISVANISIANHLPFVLFAGINVLEDQSTVFQIVETFKTLTDQLKIPFLFKASFDKANRSAIDSFRGPGLEDGLKLLAQVKQEFAVPVITDIHEPNQARAVAEVADVIQLPAFLSRQTDLIVSLAKTGKVIHIKKAQFLAAKEMQHIINKFNHAGNDQLILCERGSCFGYNNLIVDMLNFGIMKDFNYPVTFDVTHALQLPGAGKKAADGRGAAVLALAKAGISQTIAGLFLEAHPDPTQAKCDGPCAIPLTQLENFLYQIKTLDDLVKHF